MSPLTNPCAEEVRIVGLPTVTPVMVLAEPEPVPMLKVVPCALIAVEVM
jgi:hypothetical protein